MTETNRIELKRELTDELDIEKEVIAFLNNREGGIIYVGIDKDGSVVGVKDIDGDMLKIKDRIRKNISPSPMGLFDVLAENIDGTDVIKIFLASGSEKPYYKTKYGMSTRGCYIRVGTAAEPMTTDMIENLFAHRVRNSLRNIVAPRQDLTFSQLRIYYQEKKLPLNDNYLRNLELLTADGRLNYVAYLLADENGMSIKLAKYAGTDRVNLISNNEYGYCCLLTATNRLLDKLMVENQIHTELTYKRRIDTPLWDPQAIHEAVINFIVHNDYSREVPPKVEIFSDRLELTSYGRLPEGLTENEFFTGVSLPRNKELMRVFRDVEMVEALGSGMPRIMSIYNRNNFVLTENFIHLVVPFNRDESLVKPNKSLVKPDKTLVKQAQKFSETEQNFSEILQKLSEKNGKKVAQKVVERRVRILQLISKNPFITMEELAKTLGISVVAVNNNLNELKQIGLVRYGGPARGGCWDIFDDRVKLFVKDFFTGATENVQLDEGESSQLHTENKLDSKRVTTQVTPPVTPQPTPPVTPPATPQVEGLLAALKNEELTRNELMDRLKITDVKYFKTDYLQPALRAGLIEFVYPDKPNHPRQKYHRVKN